MSILNGFLREDLSERAVFKQTLHGGKETRTFQLEIFQEEIMQTFRLGASQINLKNSKG